MRPSRRLLQRSALLGLALLGVATALAVAELALRALEARRPVAELRGLHEFRPDRPWLYGLRPGAEGRLAETGDALYRINEDGFRGPRRSLPRPPGVRRVVVMGDSVAFGYGVEEEESFPRVLEAELARSAPQAHVEVVNLGVGGYNPWNEAALLADVGVTYQPDLVVVQFCINDLNDPTVHFDAQTRIALSAIPDAAFPDPSRRAEPARPPGAWLRACRASRLCARLQDAWLAWTTPEVERERLREAFAPVEDPARPEWGWLEARYAEMAETAARAGARFAVLAFPYRAQLGRSGPEPVPARLREIGRRHGWIMVDPLPDFRRARAAGERVFLDWWHPTPAGHRLAAVALLRDLACPGALGPDARRACPAAADAGPGGE